jgi:alkanesulfonate monooxygenase SsuD/methylene tetrahydromethanopterin reductase-like flavin-dependent oxidoreductase (luciferase family)
LQLIPSPTVLAKIASVLDVISHGRLEFGIGAGWYDHEYKAYGIPFEKASIRIERLEEAVQIVRKMWTEQSTTFHGTYYQVDRALNYPKPVQKPHPPILVGGEGDRLLKVVAKFADRCNFNGPLENYKRKLEMLLKHCANIGRDLKEIERTILADLVIQKTSAKAQAFLRKMHENGLLYGGYLGDGRFNSSSPDKYKAINVVGNPEECIEQLRSYREIGVNYFLFYFPMSGQIEAMQIFADQVMPELR